ALPCFGGGGGGGPPTLITGVGQVVIPMFYLSGEFPRHRGWLVLACQALFLVTGVTVAFAAPSPLWHLVPLSIAAVAVAVFAITVARLLRGRRRKITDVTLRFWRAGLVSAPFALAALAASLVRPDPRWAFAFGALYLLGFAGSIVSGMVFKIVPFLVWLHRFSRLAGKVDVPLLRDIVSPGQTLWQWRGHLAMLALLLLALITAQDVLVRLTGAALALASGGMFAILLKAARFKPDLGPLPEERGP
ncbi:MAG: hypothetical protein V3S29_01925, partial [bacterium]